MESPQMNLELLKRIMDFYEQEPRRLDMHQYHMGGLNLERFGSHEEKPPCGTTACMAGTACILSGRARPVLDDEYGNIGKGVYALVVRPFHDSMFWDVQAAQALGLTAEQGDRLFRLHDDQSKMAHLCGNTWPHADREAYESASTPEARLAALQARVLRFVLTNGAE